VTILTLLAAGTLVAGDITLDWWTFDGGGDMWTTGSDIELSGTIGQPDASIAVLTGGDIELTGGFWPGLTEEPASRVPSPGDTAGELEPDDVRPVPPP
jgi:hypothetical protein